MALCGRARSSAGSVSSKLPAVVFKRHDEVVLHVFCLSIFLSFLYFLAAEDFFEGVGGGGSEGSSQSM